MSSLEGVTVLNGKWKVENGKLLPSFSCVARESSFFDIFNWLDLRAKLEDDVGIVVEKNLRFLAAHCLKHVVQVCAAKECGFTRKYHSIKTPKGRRNPSVVSFSLGAFLFLYLAIKEKEMHNKNN